MARLRKQRNLGHEPEWFVTHFVTRSRPAAARISVYGCATRSSKPAAGRTDVIFHPFLYGSRMQANARAGFYGLGAWHSKAHVLRALYEGVVYGHLDHINQLRAVGAQMSLGRLTGGGARSSVWTQIFADALELPIEVPPPDPALGCHGGHRRGRL